MPYVHPSVFTDGYMSYVPHDVLKICGSQLPVLSVVMGVFWGITAGGGFLMVISLIWLASGTSFDASINGWGYTIVKSVYYAICGYAMLFVGFVHGSSQIPPAVLTAYEESTFGSQLALSAHGRDQKLLHKRNSFTVVRETVTEMVDTPYEIFKSMTKTQHRMAAGLVAAGAAAQVAATFAYFNKGGLAMAEVEGIRAMALELCGTTFLNAFLISLLSTAFYAQIEAGDLPFLNPVVFKKGILRTFPVRFDGEGAAKQFKRYLTNGFWWRAPARARGTRRARAPP